MSIVSVSILSPYNIFLYFLEEQKHEDSKLGIMINVGKCRLVKVIFSNIHKISDACANSFGRYTMIAQCKNGVSGKTKAQLPQQTQALQQLFSPCLFNFTRNFFRPAPHLKKRAETMHFI